MVHLLTQFCFSFTWRDLPQDPDFVIFLQERVKGLESLDNEDMVSAKICSLS